MEGENDKDYVIGDMQILLAMALVGLYALFLRKFANIPISFFIFSSQIIGAIFFFILFIKHKKQITIRKKEWMIIAMIGLAGLLNNFLYLTALRLTKVSNAVVAHRMVAVFTLFLAPLIVKEKITRKEKLVLFLSFLGIGILYLNDLRFKNSDLLGITFGLGAAFFYALIIILYRLLSKTIESVSIVNFWRFLFSTIILSPFIAAKDGLILNGKNLLILIIFGFMGGVIISGLQSSGISKTKAMHASIIGQSEPVFAIIFALAFLNETPALQSIIGGTIIIGSNIWLTFKEKR